METDLVRSIARGLRYRPLGHLVGRDIPVADLDRLEDAVRRALGPDFPAACRLAGPDPGDRASTVAKYGLLDLRFAAPAGLLGGEPQTGVPLLRALGYLPGSGAGSQHRVCDDPTCLELLRDDLDAGRTWLLLFLEGGPPGAGARADGADNLAAFRHVPAGYLPRPFRVRDACATNARGVWLWKHFYL
jgi:hypothetical protein